MVMIRFSSDAIGIVFFVTFFYMICQVMLQRVDGETQEDNLCPADWRNLSGFCYHYYHGTKLEKEKAENSCKEHFHNSHLADIQSAKENDFVINLINGLKEQNSPAVAWLGLQQINGTAHWDRGTPLTFYFNATWDPAEKLGTRGRTCAVIVARQNRQWQAEHCHSQVEFVCKTDANECSSGLHDCHNGAKCTNTYGSYRCNCTSGFIGNGTSCQDVNECGPGHNCDDDSKVVCENTYGSYTCNCTLGFTGNGTKASCQDYDECLSGSHTCDINATCTNTKGSYMCSCTPGFTGNGTNGTCQGIQCNTSSNITNLMISFNLSSNVSSDKSMVNLNETILFFCKKKLKLTGSSYSTCADNGWTVPFPKCLNVSAVVKTSSWTTTVTSTLATAHPDGDSWLSRNGLIAVIIGAIVLLIVVVICYCACNKMREREKLPVTIYSSGNGGRGCGTTGLVRPYENVTQSERTRNIYELTLVAAHCTEAQAESTLDLQPNLHNPADAEHSQAARPAAI